jgi:site-specific DNA-methyltransferase (adenine-specific)
VADLVSAPVHLVVTSPPYNVGIDYDASTDDLRTYLPMLQNVWRGCYNVMADGARICVVVPFGVGRNPYIPFDCQIMETLTNVGFTLRGRIVWDKNTTGNRTSWGSWRMASAPSLRDTTECIIVAHKGSSALSIPSEQIHQDTKGNHTPWLADPDYFMELAQDHWVIAPESAQRVKHPAPFPVELVTRLIHFYAYPGAHVLDPFGGSGSTGVAAKRLGCSATLVDLSQKYCALAQERIDHA